MKRKLLVLAMLIGVFVLFATNVFAQNNDIVYGQVTHLEFGGWSGPWPWGHIIFISVPTSGLPLRFQILDEDTNIWIDAGYTQTNTGGNYFFSVNSYTVDDIVPDYLLRHEYITFRILDHNTGEVLTEPQRWNYYSSTYQLDFMHY